MRALLILLLLAPLAPEAQTFGVDLGLVVVPENDNLGYVEVSASGVQPIGRVGYVSARAGFANGLFDAGFSDGGVQSGPGLAQSIRTVSLMGGVYRDLGGATVRAGVGPAVSRIDESLGGARTDVGLTAEVAMLDLYPAPWIGFGIGAHGSVTTSVSWVGVRLGARVRL